MRPCCSALLSKALLPGKAETQTVRRILAAFPEAPKQIDHAGIAAGNPA